TVARVPAHRAELVHRERLAAEIDLAARVAAGTRQAAPVEPDPRLGKEHRAARRQLDQRGDDEHHGQREDDPHDRRGDVEAAPAARGAPAARVERPRRRADPQERDVADGRADTKKKRVPCPGTLSTSSSAPIAFTSLRQIARPRPALEKWWRRSVGLLRNGWYRVWRALVSYPRAVSHTENSSRFRSRGRAAISTEPASVNLTALVARLSSTRESARGCPMRRSGTGCTSRTSSCFSSARGRIMSPTDANTAEPENRT